MRKWSVAFLLLAAVACRPSTPQSAKAVHPLLARIPAGEAVFVFAAYRDLAPTGVKTILLPAELSGETAAVSDAMPDEVKADEVRYLLLPDRAIYPMFGCATSLWERVQSAPGIDGNRVTLWRRRDNTEWVSAPQPVPTPLATIPAGTGVLGGEDGTERRPFQHPEFTMEKTEVTYAQYAAFLNAARPAPEESAKWMDLTRPDNPIVHSPEGYRVCADCAEHPVAFVSFHGAQAYCAFLNRALPDTRYWEIAARGDTGRIYPWGEDAAVERFANIAGEADGFPHSSPVGSFPRGQSPAGLLDLAGNAFEWTIALGKPVLRGGSWATDASWAECARREVNTPTARNNHNGFRCCGRLP